MTNLNQIILASLLLVTSCGIFGGKKLSGSTLNVNKDAVIVDGSKEIPVKQNEEVPLPQQSFLVKSPGSLPVYVIPFKSEFRKVEINLSPLGPDQIKDAYKEQVNKSLSNSLFEVHDIQNEIFQKNYDRALALIGESEKKYGAIDFLSYMKASVYYLGGDKPRAKQILESLVASGNKDEKIKLFLSEIE